MVDGSTSIAPLMEVIAEEYMQQNPEAEIVITITFPNLSRPDICSFNMLSCVLTERQPQIAVKTIISE